MHPWNPTPCLPPSSATAPEVSAEVVWTGSWHSAPCLWPAPSLTSGENRPGTQECEPIPGPSCGAGELIGNKP